MPQAAILLFSDHRLLIWPVAGICLGIYGFLVGFHILQRERTIHNTPASKIRSASTGLVEISGTATGPYTITSPLKQIECYFYRTIAWQLKQSGRSSEWVKVADERLHVPFYVDDRTGKLLVDPTGAEMDLHCDFEEQYHSEPVFQESGVPVCVERFLARHGVNSNARIKVEERCIKPEDLVFVLGTLSQNPGVDLTVIPPWASPAGQPVTMPENGDAASALNIIRLSPETAPLALKEMTQQQKIAAALAKAGITTAATWAADGSHAGAPSGNLSQAAAAVQQERDPVDAADFDLHPPVVLIKGSNEPAFFISWRSRREVVRSLGWKSALLIWGSPALVLGCAYFLAAHLR